MKYFVSCLLLITQLTLSEAAFFSNNVASKEPLSSASVIAKKMISGNTLEIELSLDEKDSFKHFKAGEFIKAYFIKGKEDVYKQDQQNRVYFRRSYSIASTPEEIIATGNIKIAISLVNNGLASHWFTHARVGDFFLFRSPRGKMVVPQGDYDRLILLSTGTGVAPYRSWLNAIAKLKNKKIRIIVGYRNPEQAIYQEEFLQLAKDNPNITYHVSYSQANIQGDLTGHVQSHLANLSINPVKDRIFICGGPYFLEDTKVIVESLGFINNETYIKEKYNWSGHKEANFTIKPVAPPSK